MVNIVGKKCWKGIREIVNMKNITMPEGKSAAVMANGENGGIRHVRHFFVINFFYCIQRITSAGCCPSTSPNHKMSQ
jgi:hypothetical protein